MNKLLIIIVLGIIAVGGYMFWGRQYQYQAPVQGGSQTKEQMPQAASHVVSYTASGFVPPALVIKAGDSVAFKNDSSETMWPASAMHPTHAVYPTTGGCIGSTFDACRGVQPDETWSFTFDISGTWKYHNHLNPSFFGAITVE